MIRNRWQYAAVHFSASLVLALALFGLVRFTWFPGDLFWVSDGVKLFTILMAVDVLLGPMLGTLVFDRSKSARSLFTDLLVIATLQLGAMVYGMLTVHAARPVFVVFELYRYQIVHATDLIESELDLAPPELRGVPPWGPMLLSIRLPADGQEIQNSLNKALMLGIQQAAQPELWQPYANAKPMILREGVTASHLTGHPALNSLFSGSSKLPADDILLFPLISREKALTVAVAKSDGQIMRILPVDGFELLKPYLRPSTLSDVAPNASESIGRR